MTTAEIIQSMKDNLANAYTKLANKRAVIPSEKNIANLAACADSIVPKLQVKTVNPSTSQQTISADSGYDGLSSVPVNAVTSSIDSNIVAGNIKKDVTILGVAGTLYDDRYKSLVENTVTGVLVIGNDITKLRHTAFAYCTYLTEVQLPNTITYLGMAAFDSCGALKTINIPANIAFAHPSGAFNNCPNLEFVTLGNGFNCDSLKFSTNTKLSADTIVAMLNALADRTGQSAYTLALGSTNLAKLSAEQIAIATSKNWTLA